jgi:NTP pyrophosphatase (non-canonical NTP hydrolase)
MNGNEYQRKAMRTNNHEAGEKILASMQAGNNTGEILNASLGLSGEVGELNDLLKKWIFHDKNIDREHIKKEIGDIMWYIALMAEAFGFELDSIMITNIEKLEARYPEGFDTARSNNRKEGDI